MITQPNNEIMTSKPTRMLALSALLLANSQTTQAAPADDWEKFNDWNIGNLLFPSLHFHGVGGFSTGDTEELASGGHDPKRDPFSVQALEPGLAGLDDRLVLLDGLGRLLLQQELELGVVGNVPRRLAR